MWPFKRKTEIDQEQKRIGSPDFHIDTTTFRGKEVPNITKLEHLRSLTPPDIVERVQGIENLTALGHLSLQGDNNTFVFYMAEDGEAIPRFFLVGDTQTTLGFDWPIIWKTEKVDPVPDFFAHEGKYFTIIRGTASIVTDSNQDDWLALIGNAVCSRRITLVEDADESSRSS